MTGRPPWGANLSSLAKTNTVEFRLWASRAKTANVQIVERSGNAERVARTIPMSLESPQVFVAVAENCPPGTLYRFQINDGAGRPDPYSRFQPFGVHGPSQVIDPHHFHWTDQSWKGIDKRDGVIYELHIGSFTDAGTYLSAIEKFPQLVDLGITAIELMPLAQSPGKWNWGYDGVNYFAPRNTFGTPDELKQFINEAHRLGLAVIHDVVYNHVGPEGNYLNEFAHYRSPVHGTPWGDSLNFDGEHHRNVREFVIDNGLYWLDEYHFDGLRLDAIHYMFDRSELHIVNEFRQRFREYERSVDRKLFLIAEANIFDRDLLHDPQQNGDRYDAIWSDCLMHSIYSHGKPDLRLTNRHYIGTPDLVESLEHAYVFSAPGAIRADATIRQNNHPNRERDYQSSLIMALQTHDSVGNHPHGKRLHHLISDDFQMAAAPLILLYPSIPMLFMGEEWATSAPFPFFADFEDEGLRAAVDRGRREEYPHHHWADSPLPSDPLAFLNSKLDRSQGSSEMFTWYQQLLALRRQGLQEGWLSIKNKSTHFEPEPELFTMRYTTLQQQVTIACRLGTNSSPPAQITPANPFEIFLQTSGVQPIPTGGFELQNHQCCIWRERV